MVKEIKTAEEFHELLAGAGSKLVVVDFFATWCGPCMMIAPKVVDLGTKYPDIIIVKVDVDSNEAVAAEAGISAMPTFKFYKEGKEVDELVGASVDKLVAKIEKNK